MKRTLKIKMSINNEYCGMDCPQLKVPFQNGNIYCQLIADSSKAVLRKVDLKLCRCLECIHLEEFVCGE